jgi:D-hexose-6-phosphate mutarotase
LTFPSSIQRTELAPGYPVFDIHHHTCTARVAQNGAHLMEWTPAGQSPVLYLSPQAVLKEGKAIRGGVPICWPWFGPHETDKTLPAHGFVRNRFLELTEASEDQSGVTLKFALH